MMWWSYSSILYVDEESHSFIHTLCPSETARVKEHMFSSTNTLTVCRLSCKIIDRRYVSLCFCNEKCLSPVTGRLWRKTLRAIITFRKMSMIFSLLLHNQSSAMVMKYLGSSALNVKLQVLCSSLGQDSSGLVSLSALELWGSTGSALRLLADGSIWNNICVLFLCEILLYSNKCLRSFR